MEIGTPFVADGESAEAAQPREGAFDHPPVATEPLAQLDAAAGDALG